PSSLTATPASGPPARGCRWASATPSRPDAMAVSLSRVAGFRALHRFFRPDWTEARNREAFGPLSDPPGHAHDYRCVVTVAGPLETSRGMVLDLAELDRILHDEVVAPFDGKHLDPHVPEFAYGRTLATLQAIGARNWRSAGCTVRATSTGWTRFTSGPAPPISDSGPRCPPRGWTRCRRRAGALCWRRAAGPSPPSWQSPPPWKPARRAALPRS